MTVNEAPEHMAPSPTVISTTRENQNENETKHDIPARDLEYVAQIRAAIANQSIAAQARRERERQHQLENELSPVPSEMRADGIVAPPSSPWNPGEKRSSSPTTSLNVLTVKAKDGVTSLINKGRGAISRRTGRTSRRSLASKMSKTSKVLKSKVMGAKKRPVSLSRRQSSLSITRPSNPIVTISPPLSPFSRLIDDVNPFEMDDSDAATLIGDTDNVDETSLLLKSEKTASKYDLPTGMKHHETRSLPGQLQSKFRTSMSRFLNGAEILSVHASHGLLGRKSTLRRWSRL
ncbi:hypothetical protein PV10_02140 [Exophiala mesophila]|uniref:Uncharacterized protein n=1 Tax=Exophiala mesophila TaxID=212818 RepID=A0A0D1ZID4_EXOME|nr:uncharacterized protein PV10_02140 [Exophiala mesophila]KIV94367.1 hypothetical protein PV10_02140 [Exophiala mesophila]